MEVPRGGLRVRALQRPGGGRLEDGRGPRADCALCMRERWSSVGRGVRGSLMGPQDVYLLRWLEEPTSEARLAGAGGSLLVVLLDWMGVSSARRIAFASA